MTTFQKETIDLIFSVMNSGDFRNNINKGGFKDIITRLIRWYPEVTNDGVKTWKKLKYYKTHHRISERAAKKIESHTESDKDLVDKILHYEHIVPVSVTLVKLLNLGPNPTKDQIVNVMNECEVVILTKEEAEILDGSASKTYSLDGKLQAGKSMKQTGSGAERLKVIEAKIDDKYSSNQIYK